MEESANSELHTIRVPEHSIRRLSVYLRFLYQARSNGMFSVSAPQMARELNFDPTQIVKDLSLTGIKGRPRAGYNTFELIQSVEDYLNYDKPNRTFLVGAGNLGTALLAYPGLETFGLKIVAGFDINPERTAKPVSNITILHISKLPEMVKRLRVEIGILTTPAQVAQQVASMMADAGIKAIWNFAPINLKLPAHVIVQNTSMYSNVAIMLKKLQRLNQQTEINSNHFI